MVLQLEINFPMLKPVGTCLVTKFTNQGEVKIEPPGHWNNLTTSGLYYKHVTIVIYDRNDSVQYHKTTIMIVIDDP